MSQTNTLTVEALTERYKTACDLRGDIDRPRILECVQKFLAGITKTPPTAFRFAESSKDFLAIARAARDARAAYLVASGAAKIQVDDYGALYRQEIPGDEALLMVKVVNSTAEPDGTFKDYFLRVPPTMRTAREAVAWTFGKTADEYAPAIQT